MTEETIIDPLEVQCTFEYWKREAMRWQLLFWSLCDDADANLILKCKRALEVAQEELDEHVAAVARGKEARS